MYTRIGNVKKMTFCYILHSDNHWNTFHLWKMRIENNIFNTEHTWKSCTRTSWTELQKMCIPKLELWGARNYTAEVVMYRGQTCRQRRSWRRKWIPSWEKDEVRFRMKIEDEVERNFEANFNANLKTELKFYGRSRHVQGYWGRTYRQRRIWRKN